MVNKASISKTEDVPAIVAANRDGFLLILLKGNYVRDEFYAGTASRQFSALLLSAMLIFVDSAS